MEGGGGKNETRRSVSFITFYSFSLISAAVDFFHFHNSIFYFISLSLFLLNFSTLFIPQFYFFFIKRLLSLSLSEIKLRNFLDANHK